MGNFILYVLVIIAIWGGVITIRNERREKKMQEELELEQEKKENKDQEETSTTPEKMGFPSFYWGSKGTRDLFLETLTNIGCQYQLDDNADDKIYFAYQGEYFVAHTSNDILYVHLWDTHWGTINLSDIDEMSRMRRAINFSNIQSTITTVFTIDNERNTMDVHAKATIPFIPSMPNLDDFLRAELSEFFHTHRIVFSELNMLREKEQKAKQTP